MIRIATLQGELPSAEWMAGQLPEAWLSAWRERHGASLTGQHRRESLGAIWLLFRLFPEAKLVYAPSGKPLLSGVSASISLTHGGGAVFCAFLVPEEGGAAPSIGIDAEPVRQSAPARRTALARRWFSPGEQDALASFGASEESFLYIWTAKEAMVKASGLGLAGLSAADSLEAERLGMRLYRFSYRDLRLCLCAPAGIAVDLRMIEMDT